VVRVDRRYGIPQPL